MGNETMQEDRGDGRNGYRGRSKAHSWEEMTANQSSSVPS